MTINGSTTIPQSTPPSSTSPPVSSPETKTPLIPSSTLTTKNPSRPPRRLAKSSINSPSSIIRQRQKKPVNGMSNSSGRAFVAEDSGQSKSKGVGEYDGGGRARKRRKIESGHAVGGQGNDTCGIAHPSPLPLDISHCTSQMDTSATAKLKKPSSPAYSSTRNRNIPSHLDSYHTIPTQLPSASSSTPSPSGVSAQPKKSGTGARMGERELVLSRVGDLGEGVGRVGRERKMKMPVGSARSPGQSIGSVGTALSATTISSTWHPAFLPPTSHPSSINTGQAQTSGGSSTRSGEDSSRAGSMVERLLEAGRRSAAKDPDSGVSTLSAFPGGKNTFHQADFRRSSDRLASRSQPTGTPSSMSVNMATTAGYRHSARLDQKTASLGNTSGMYKNVEQEMSRKKARALVPIKTQDIITGEEPTSRRTADEKKDIIMSICGWFQIPRTQLARNFNMELNLPSGPRDAYLLSQQEAKEIIFTHCQPPYPNSDFRDLVFDTLMRLMMEGSGQPIKGTLHPLGEVVARLAPVVFIVAWIAARVTGPVKRLEAYQRGTVVPAFERKMQALAACEEVVMLELKDVCRSAKNPMNDMLGGLESSVRTVEEVLARKLGREVEPEETDEAGIPLWWIETMKCKHAVLKIDSLLSGDGVDGTEAGNGGSATDVIESGDQGAAGERQERGVDNHRKPERKRSDEEAFESELEKYLAADFKKYSQEGDESRCKRARPHEVVRDAIQPFHNGPEGYDTVMDMPEQAEGGKADCLEVGNIVQAGRCDMKEDGEAPQEDQAGFPASDLERETTHFNDLGYDHDDMLF